MELNIKISRKGQPAEGITAMVIDGPASWEEIAAVSNEEGVVSLSVEAAGTYTVRLFVPTGTVDVAVKTGSVFEHKA